VGGLCAEGPTEVYDVGHIERGYEDFVDKLRALGSEITLVEDS
jgi:UDP-N-acetylglucosamine 1-carboxyvinyltransferase